LPAPPNSWSLPPYTGGDGDDRVFGQGGNDRMIWNPGDDSDLPEGGDDIDTAEVNGGNGAETFTITANGTRRRFDRVSSAPCSLDTGTTENLVLNANGGDDTFVWNPGDGSDVVDGQDGTDTLVFNGANIAETISIAANGGMRLTRDVAPVAMDLNGVEHIQLNTLGGADKITVNNLTGTDAKQVDIDLAATAGSTQGDGQPDQVTLNGTNGNDQNNVFASDSKVTVTGLPAQVSAAR
jgi:hypothetical protein